MSSCPLYNDSNLAFTGSKSNNPFAVIQNAGKKKRRKSFKNHKKSYKNTHRRLLRKTQKRRKHQ